MKKTAWVAGASGLIGSHLIELLNAHPAYDKVVAFVRQAVITPPYNQSKVEQRCVDYTQLQAPDNERVDDVFCALGSTSKKTPDKEAYYKIDVLFPLAVAELGLKHGASFYGLVSAHGAKPSRLSFYLEMKSRLEHSLKQLDYSHLAIARPSLLKGDRKEYRPAERLSEGFMSLLPGNYKAIHAKDVAAALIQAANNKTDQDTQSVSILSSAEMQNASQLDSRSRV